MAGKANLRKKNFNSIKVKNGVAAKEAPLKKGDARFKILQKNRSKLVDARERLAQMAKGKDARAKIQKIRQLRTAIQNKTLTETVRPIGSGILKKMDRNGHIVLSTNKSKKQTAHPNTDINSAIRKELGLLTSPRKLVSASAKSTAAARGLQRAGISPMYRNPIAAAVAPNINRYPRNELTEAYVPLPVIKRTIHNDVIREMPSMPDFSQQRAIEKNLYTWTRPPSRNALISAAAKTARLDELRQSVEITARNNFVVEQPMDNWNFADPSVRSFKLSSASMYIDDDEAMDTSPVRGNLTPAQRMKTGIHARLDTPIIPNQSQGIFAQPKPKPSEPVGYRIVVSNLQQTVTQDDITELFEDIGELLVSRLVRPGTAEVIYKNIKDAQKAVDTYHNRQLDGQPMKCLLVNPRSGNTPTSPAVRPTKSTSSSVLRNSSGITKKTVTTKSSSSSSNKLVPDISTIHKVLFHTS